MPDPIEEVIPKVSKRPERRRYNGPQEAVGVQGTELPTRRPQNNEKKEM